MSRQGRVFLDELWVGTIQELDDGQCVFGYRSEYLEQLNAQPISLNIPLSSELVVTRGLHPFFDGLIPEGWLLHLATRNWKLDPRDRVSLLFATCADCIGAVRILPMEEP